MKNEFISPYSYNKSIRFRLEHEKGELPKIECGEADLVKLIDLGKSLKKAFEDLIYKKDNLGKLDSFVSIKKQWLKKYFKNDFYANGKIQDFSITNFKYIADNLKVWSESWQNNLDALQKLVRQNDFEKARKSGIAYLLSQLNNSYSFLFVKDFSEYVNHKNSQAGILKLQKNVSDFEKELITCIIEFLPSQSAGLVVAGCSMNYYTVNKKPKKYDDILETLKKDFEIKDKDYIATKQYKSSQKSKLYELINKGLSKDRILIELANDDNKEVNFVYGGKIIEESFEQELFKGNCLDEVISLTKKIDRLNLQKDDKNNLSKETKEQISKLKIQRGFYFIKRAKGKRHNNYFRSYVGFCENFKREAQERGRLLARIRAIQKEKIESKNLRYWSFILDDGKDKFLWLVQNDNMQEFKREISSTNESGDLCLYQFNSLTMRALHKLCFAEESSFVEAMPPDLKKQQNECKKASNDPAVNEKTKKRYNLNNVKTKDELTLSFLKNLMKCKYAYDILDLNHFKLDALQTANTLNEFEESLEDACYHVEKIKLSDLKINELVGQYNILSFKITSYDLEERNKNTHQTKESDYKRHTKEIWNRFWNEKSSDIRLNPEIKIRYREKDDEIEKYLSNKGFDIEKIRNRFLYKQYTVTFTFTLNAGKRYPKLAFVKTEEIHEKINEFNEEFNKQCFDELYKYGLDRGNIELATLCIAKFAKNDTYEYNGKQYLKPIFPKGEQDIKAYELKKEWYDKTAVSDIETKPHNERKPKRVVANMSYFIDKAEDKDWFCKKTCTCVDLTTAKVIKDKLVLNGDILTFLKLKKEAAKRILFGLVAQNQITSKNKELKWKSDDESDPDSTKLIYGQLDEEESDRKKEDNVIYFYEGKKGRDFDNLLVAEKTQSENGELVKKYIHYSKGGVRENLQDYLDNLLNEKEKGSDEINKHVPTIEKINHLRDAIIANMAGVISYLQKRYPGVVVLEDLNHSLMLKHFENLNINISNRFELALIQKFQTLGLVPPHIKDYLEIRTNYRNKKESSQFGALIFVDEKGTSKNCPYCEKKWEWGKEKEDELKFLEHKYICGKKNSCGFDTKNIQGKFEFLSEIDDPDKIAAYNVAKRGEKFVANGTKHNHL